MKRKKLPAGQAIGTHTSTSRPQWRATAAALAAAVLLGTWASDASALALGRITVRSALGEPLNAEIDLPEIAPDEVASLRTHVAPPEAFKAAGLDYNAALSDVTITLEKRPDGGYFLRLKSPRTVTEPFVDLLLETSWSSGRITRDYTMLFDPPVRQNQQPLTAQIAPGAAKSSPPASVTPLPPASAVARPAPSPRAPATPTARASTPAAAPAPKAAAPSAPSGEGKQVTVQNGDTAGKIAAANKPPAVSLDQMLVAMLRANPDAFVNGNVNRLRAGTVLEIPTEEQAALVPTDDARQTLVAQSRDFNEFRRRLAEGVPTTHVAAAERQSSGKVTAQVEEKRPAAASPDKLTLSKATAQGKSGAEDKIARDRAAQDSATRVAELSKNISDLNKLGTGNSTASAAGTASAAKPGVAVPMGSMATAKPAPAPAPAAPAPAAAAAAKPVVPAAATPAVPEAAKPASAPAVATTTVASAPSAAPTITTASATAPAASTAVASASSAAPSASAPAAAAPVKPAAKPAAKPAPRPPEPSFLDEILDNPMILGAGGLVVALLAGFGFYRVHQRKKTAQVDSSFLESRLQPDSFFGASGGQRIDTNESSATGSSMVYSPSQLDAAGDVDPVAEADVYLAYGRDLQAEEILKEALRTQPHRVAIHTKLLEIYAKRRDAKAFELVATEAYGLTHGEGPEWERVCELGQELDPSNSLYRPGGQPGAASAASASAKHSAAVQTQPVPMQAQAPASPDIDLDLDFSLGDDEPAAPVVTAAAPAPAAQSSYERTQTQTYERTAAIEAPATPPMPSLDMDFGSPAPAPAPVAAAPAKLDAPDLVLDENSLNFDVTPRSPAPAPAARAPAAPAPASDAGMLEFDLGGISLDLEKPKAAAPAPQAAAAAANGPDTEAPTTAGSPLSTGGFEDSSSDPLATKLALAQEFNAIGDPDGARSLAQEVIAEASGELKSKAQKFLAEIG
jgi:pilus assembly protein FimV